MSKALAAAVCLGLFTATVLAQTQSPSNENDTRPAATAPANDPRQLFFDTLRELHGSENLTLEVQRSESMSAAGALPNQELQAVINHIDEGTQCICIHRPDKLRFSCTWAPRPDGSRRYAPLVIFDRPSILIATRRDAEGRLKGSFGEMKNRGLNDVLRSWDCEVRFVAPELARLLDSESYEQFFRLAGGWEWLGPATDNGARVWRVKFTDTDPEPKSWEAWITQDTPHRLTRLVVGGPSTVGVEEPKPGTTLPQDDSSEDPSKVTYTTYPLRTRVELRITKWDTATALTPHDFERPEGDFKERPFKDSEPAHKIGDAVPLPPLMDVDGHAVELSKHTAPVVLDFWFAACGPCMYWTPRVEALVEGFSAKGVKLYGVNGSDAPEKAKRTAAKEGWKHVTNLVDGDWKYHMIFSITGCPTVVIIGADGRLLYREFPGEEGAMDRLRGVLEQATAGKPTGPATRAAE